MNPRPDETEYMQYEEMNLSIHNPIIRLDNREKIEYISSGAQHLLALTEKQVTGRQLHELPLQTAQLAHSTHLNNSNLLKKGLGPDLDGCQTNELLFCHPKNGTTWLKLEKITTETTSGEQQAILLTDVTTLKLQQLWAEFTLQLLSVASLLSTEMIISQITEVSTLLTNSELGLWYDQNQTEPLSVFSQQPQSGENEAALKSAKSFIKHNEGSKNCCTMEKLPLLVNLKGTQPTLSNEKVIEHALLIPLTHKGETVATFYLFNCNKEEAIQDGERILHLFQCLKPFLYTTEEKHSMHRLTAEDQQHIIKKAPALIQQITPDGTIIFSNNYFPNHDHQGLTTIGSNLFDLIHPPHVGMVKKSIAQAAKTGENGEFLVAVVCPDGEKLWYSTTVSPTIVDGHVLSLVLVSVEITTQQKLQQQFKRRQEIEQSIMTISSWFVNYENLDDTLNATLKRIGGLCKASRSYLFSYDSESNIISNTHEWCQKDILPQIDQLQQLPAQLYPWWMDKLHNREPIYLRTLNDLPPSASDLYITLKEQQIQSLMVFPIFRGDKLVGFIGLDNIDGASSWSELDMKVLNITADTIGHVMERERQLAQIKENEEKYRTLVESADEGILILQKGIIVFANSLLRNKMGGGYTNEELIGYHYLEFIPPKERERIVQYGQKRFLSPDKIKRYETKAIRKDGSLLMIEVNASIFEYAGENAVMVLLRDITDRKKAEKALLKSKREAEQQEQFLEKVFDSAPEIMMLLDEHNRIIRLNQAGRKRINKTMEEVKGLRFGEAFDCISLPEHGATCGNGNSCKHCQIRTAIEDVVESGAECFKKEMPIQIITDRGLETLTILLSTVRLYARNKKSTLLTIDNISERKALEDELLKAKERAEESDRLKSAFLANMSHEIRTPMNGIIGFSELMKEPVLTEENRTRFANIIINSSKQLLGIVSDILDISRIETGQMELHEENVNLTEILNETHEFHLLNAQEKGLELNLEMNESSAIPKVCIDPHKLKQILDNLISNAIKFTNAGHITIGYTLKGEFLEFYVKDTGIGIEASEQKSIFNRFQQANRTIAKNFGGNGLGLAICNSLCQLLGGKIWLTSEPGKGTTFYFQLPYHPIVSSVNKSNTASRSKEISFSTEPTILVAEDTDMNFQLIEELLTSFTPKIIRVTNGKEAIRQCRDNQDIDLVLMDVKMPELNGYDATTAIKLMRPNLPVIIQTAYAFAGEEELAREIGCDAFLPKPIKHDQFNRVIEGLLNQ